VIHREVMRAGGFTTMRPPHDSLARTPASPGRSPQWLTRALNPRVIIVQKNERPPSACHWCSARRTEIETERDSNGSQAIVSPRR
jgi:hypothetical protein